jgi:RNA 3'-phosphate cyclase
MSVMTPLAHSRLAIDGAHGEGGGQVVRTAVALAAIAGQPIDVTSIRARRDTPGLGAQHVAAVRAVAAICDAEVEGLAVGASAFAFTPHGLHGGDYRFDVGTAGSVSLVLQALLPVMLSCRERYRVSIIGGTDVPLAPPIDYMRWVLLPLLARMGARVDLEVRRRGYYPRGGGEVRVTCRGNELRPLILGTPGTLAVVSGSAHVAGMAASVAERMRRAAAERLRLGGLKPVQIEARALGQDEATGSGGAIVAVAETDMTRLGAAWVAERGVRAEEIGEAVGGQLSADLLNGAAVDVHAADQLLVYLALAGGGGFTVRTVSSHAATGMWLIEQFLPVRFSIEERGRLARVTVTPRH